MSDKIWQTIQEGEIPESNGLFVEPAYSGGWFLKFGLDGAHVWLSDGIRLQQRPVAQAQE